MTTELTYVQRLMAIADVRDRIESSPTQGDWMVIEEHTNLVVLSFVHEQDAKDFADLTGFRALPLTAAVAA